MRTIGSIFRKSLLLAGIFISGVAFAQTNFNLAPKPSLVVSGTSSLHDWSMTSNTATGKAVMVVENNKVVEVKSMTVEMPAESIKSGKKGMDGNAYKALNTSKFKSIKFDLISANKNTDGTWNLVGTFTIAGSSKQVTIKATEKYNGGYEFEGKYKFKFADYKMEAPTALMGTVKTGENLTIDFKVKFQ